MKTQTNSGHISDCSLEEYRPYLLRYAQLQLRDNALAEDAVQETLLAALEGGTRFSGKSSVKTWLTGILKHKILDLFRKRAKESRQISLETELESGTGDFESLFHPDGHWETSPQAWSNPLTNLENKKFWEVFEICANSMPANTAQVFMMREFLGLSTEDICKDMQITATNCWVMLYRARMSLRLCLEHNWFGGNFKRT